MQKVKAVKLKDVKKFNIKLEHFSKADLYDSDQDLSPHGILSGEYYVFEQKPNAMTGIHYPQGDYQPVIIYPEYRSAIELEDRKELFSEAGANIIWMGRKWNIRFDPHYNEDTGEPVGGELFFTELDETDNKVPYSKTRLYNGMRDVQLFGQPNFRQFPVYIKDKGRDKVLPVFLVYETCYGDLANMNIFIQVDEHLLPIKGYFESSQF